MGSADKMTTDDAIDAAVSPPQGGPIPQRVWENPRSERQPPKGNGKQEQLLLITGWIGLHGVRRCRDTRPERVLTWVWWAAKKICKDDQPRRKFGAGGVHCS